MTPTTTRELAEALQRLRNGQRCTKCKREIIAARRSSDTGVGVTDSDVEHAIRAYNGPLDDHNRHCIRAALESFAATLATRTDAQAAGDDIEGLRKDAARYRWLRVQHWSNSDVCIVRHPKNAVRLGHECPSDERLDELIDASIAQASARVGS